MSKNYVYGFWLLSMLVFMCSPTTWFGNSQQTLSPEQNTSTNSFFVVVSYSVEDSSSFPVNTPPAPGGHRWIYLVATFHNLSDTSINIEQTTVRLIDTEGNHYLPELPDDATQPAIVRADIASNTHLYGLIRFGMPQEAQASLLEWCPRGICQRVPIP